jgi:hypothetical protein
LHGAVAEAVESDAGSGKRKGSAEILGRHELCPQ